MGTYQTNMLVFCEMWPYVPQNDLIITAEILDEHGIKAVKNISKDGVDSGMGTCKTIYNIQ